MDRRQTARRPSRQSTRQPGSISNPKRCSAHSRQNFLLLRSFLRVFHHAPLVWVIVSAILVGTATAAVMSIVDPDASIRPWESAQSVMGLRSGASNALSTPSPSIATAPSEQISPQPNAALRHRQPKPTAKAASPLSAVAAILISCAAGCFFLSQWLKPQSLPRHTKMARPIGQPRQPRQSLPTVPVPVPLKFSEPESKRGLLQRPDLPQQILPQQNLPQPVQPIQVFNLQTSYQGPATSEASINTDATPESSVSVVPTAEDHPLDWNEPSLADSLDLRQRRPLSDWL